MDLRNVLLPILIFFQMYGTKIWFVDTIVISSALILFVFSRKPTLSKFQLSWVTLLALYFVYMLSAQLASPDIDLYIVGRYLRVILSALFLAVIVNAIQPCSGKVKRIVSNLILLHGVVVVAQMLLPQLKEYMAPLVAFPKDVAIVRSFGLVGSYDMASLYLCVGMIIFISRYIEERKERYVLSLFFLWISGLFTGRTFMVIGTVIFLIAVVAILWSSGFLTKAWVVGCSAAALIVYWVTFGPLLVVSLGLVEVGDYTQLSSIQNSNGYYIGTLDVMRRYIFLPSDPIHLFLGGLADPPSDNGYVRVIYTTGIMGLAWLVFVYIYLASAVWASRAIDRWVVATIVMLILVYNFKMLMVGARGITEMMLLLAYDIHSDRSYSLRSMRRVARKIACS